MTVTLNRPPYIPIPFSNALMCMLLYAINEARIKLFITILENNIDLSRLIVRALKSNKNIIKMLTLFFLFYIRLFYII